MGPTGIKEDQGPFQRRFFAVHTQSPPTLKSVLNPPKGGFFFAYMDVGTSREAWMPGGTRTWMQVDRERQEAGSSVPKQQRITNTVPGH